MTRNSRPFAVTSTTCSTLLNELVVVTAAVFSPPIDTKQALHSSTPSQCVRDDSSSSRLKKESSGYSQASRQTYIGITNTRYQVYTFAVYSMRDACGELWVVFLEHGGVALGILKLPVCTNNQAWIFSLSVSHHFPSRASVAGGVCRPRSKAPFAYV